MVLGITGITGSGKHMAADFYKHRDWIIYDVDKVAHYLYRPYTHVWKAIVKHFGEGILTQNDKIDRQKLGAIVFNPSDPDKADQELKILGEIIHPSVRRHLKNEVHRHFRRKSNIVIIAALWGEITLFDLSDKILLMRAASELSRERIMKRDSISGDVYHMRARNQSEPPQYDFVIENNGSEKDLYLQLGKLNLS